MTTNILRLKHNPLGYRNESGPSKPLFPLEYHKTYLNKDALDISPDSRYLLHEFHGMTPEEWSRKGGIYKPAGSAFQHQPTQTNGLDSKWSNTSWNDTILISGKTDKTPPDFGSQYYPLPVLFNSKGSRVFGDVGGGPEQTDNVAQELFEEIERELLKEKLRKEIQTSGKPIEFTHLITNSQHIPSGQIHPKIVENNLKNLQDNLAKKNKFLKSFFQKYTKKSNPAPTKPKPNPIHSKNPYEILDSTFESISKTHKRTPSDELRMANIHRQERKEEAKTYKPKSKYQEVKDRKPKYPPY